MNQSKFHSALPEETKSNKRKHAKTKLCSSRYHRGDILTIACQVFVEIQLRFQVLELFDL